MFSVGCILALGIYAVWKEYDRHHGGTFVSGFFRGVLIFGGITILWTWAKNSDEQPKDENAKALKEK